MVSKVIILTLLVAAVSAGHHAFSSSQYIEKHDGHHEVVPHGHGKHHHHDYFIHPKYKFEYKVKDHHTKDYKTQHEARVHDDVKGYYSLHDSDGTERHVHYHSDKHSGSHADVKHSTHHVVPKHHHHH